MQPNRRRFVQGGLAAGAFPAVPARLRAQQAPPAARTIRAVLHGDLRVFDPVWTTANMTSYHAAMVYDTLFGVDDKFEAKPQMVSKWGLSDDRKTYNFELRDGLRFTDGTVVTATDRVASIRRWAARDGGGQHMLSRLADTPVKDDKTFQLVMKEPYTLAVDWLAKAATNVCYVMREKEALTDPNQQITTILGSGPFTFNQDAVVQGQRYVYDRNANYAPRSEPAVFTSGGKVVNVDRVIFENIADEAIRDRHIRAGEIDMTSFPMSTCSDLPPARREIKLEVLNKQGQLGWCRVNWLYPPFNNASRLAQAMLHLIHHTEVMKATLGDEKYSRAAPRCSAWHADGKRRQYRLVQGWQNIEKAKQLLRNPAMTAVRWSCCRRPTSPI